MCQEKRSIYNKIRQDLSRISTILLEKEQELSWKIKNYPGNLQQALSWNVMNYPGIRARFILVMQELSWSLQQVLSWNIQKYPGMSTTCFLPVQHKLSRK